MPDKVLPETDDDLSQQNLREWFGRSALSNYVEEGLSITADYGVPDFDITAGKLYMIDDSNTHRQEIMVTVAARTGVSLTDSATNHIYVSASLASGDSDRVTIAVNTTGSEPSDPFGDGTSAESLKIGEVDTTNDTTTESNRTMPANA